MGISPAVQPGHAIGRRYLLREPIGRGGMSVVWRAEDTVLGREVAVKVLSAEVAADPASLTRLYAEARAAAGLHHDNVVEVYDYGETTLNNIPMPYVVMELVPGRPLNALLSGGPLPWRLSMLIGTQVAAALAAAHDHGLVHRDVKPANVMVAADGVKLVDFGISAAVGDHDIVSNEIIGTPAYLAPERLVNGTVRPATDVYALGVLLYLMLTGRMPWNASTTTQMLKAHLYRDPAPLPTVPGLPDAVAELIHQCLAKTPSERPAAVAAARVLRQAAGLPPAMVLTTLPDADRPTTTATVPTAPVPLTLRGRIAAWPVRYRTAAVAALLLAAATTTVLAWPHRAEPAPVAAASPLTCDVAYTTRVVSSGRSTTTVAVTNTAPTSTGPWTLSFQLPGGQRLVRGSNASWRQAGPLMKVDGTGLAAGATTSAWFDADYDRTALLPQSFTLNDVACQAALSVQGPPTTPVARPTTRPAAVARTHAAKRSGPRAGAPAGPAKPPAPPPGPARQAR